MVVSAYFTSKQILPFDFAGSFVIHTSIQVAYYWVWVALFHVSWQAVIYPVRLISTQVLRGADCNYRNHYTIIM